MATSFYVLLLAPLPFLRAAGFLIGTNVLLDTLVIRTLLMPTTYAAFLESDSVPRPWRQRLDHGLAWLALIWAIVAIPTLLIHDRHALHIIPSPSPIQIISTRHHPIQFFYLASAPTEHKDIVSGWRSTLAHRPPALADGAFRGHGEGLAASGPCTFLCEQDKMAGPPAVVFGYDKGYEHSRTDPVQRANCRHEKNLDGHQSPRCRLV